MEKGTFELGGIDLCDYYTGVSKVLMVSSKVIDIIYESIEIVSLSGYMKTRLRELYHSPSLSKTEIKGNGSRGRLSQSICSRIFPRFNQYESDVSQWPPDSKPSRGPNKVKELSRWQRKN